MLFDVQRGKNKTNKQTKDSKGSSGTSRNQENGNFCPNHEDFWLTVTEPPKRTLYLF